MAGDFALGRRAAIPWPKGPSGWLLLITNTAMTAAISARYPPPPSANTFVRYAHCIRTKPACDPLDRDSRCPRRYLLVRAPKCDSSEPDLSAGRLNAAYTRDGLCSWLCVLRRGELASHSRRTSVLRPLCDRRSRGAALDGRSRHPRSAMGIGRACSGRPFRVARATCARACGRSADRHYRLGFAADIRRHPFSGYAVAGADRHDGADGLGRDVSQKYGVRRGDRRHGGQCTPPRRRTAAHMGGSEYGIRRSRIRPSRSGVRLRVGAVDSDAGTGIPRTSHRLPGERGVAMERSDGNVLATNARPVEGERKNDPLGSGSLEAKLGAVRQRTSDPRRTKRPRPAPAYSRAHRHVAPRHPHWRSDSLVGIGNGQHCRRTCRYSHLLRRAFGVADTHVSDSASDPHHRNRQRLLGYKHADTKSADIRHAGVVAVVWNSKPPCYESLDHSSADFSL